MPGISAPRTGHRAGRSGSLRSSLLGLVLVPCLGLAAAWGYAAYLLRDAGHRTSLLTVSALVVIVLLWSLIRGIGVARALSARLAGLRADTLTLAQHEIPDVVGRLRAGESVPPPPAWAPSRRAADELQQTADGLAAVRQAALAAIVHQAQGREGTKKVFLNIARRTQILIHRQISMLDALEREHEEPDLLRELFAVDHLATRMRRNAENLVILGGALPARRWRNAVPVVNVLRSAVSETENYSRVVVQGVPRTSLSGQAVADVIHLIAELIENGTTFSPPYTQVQVSAQEVPKGLAVEVEDRGLGMGEEDYERLNDYLANPPELDVSALGDDLRLGLFVVARLAARHDIQVTLRPSPYGGTRAVVLVPSVLLEQAQPAASVPGLPAGARVTRTPVPELGQPADGGPTDGTDGGDELSGALAGVLGGLLGGGPTAAEGPLAGNADGAGGGTGTGEQQDGGLTVGELLAQYDRYGDAGAREAGPLTNGGLPVGASIPGLPGAVVVPRPAMPRPYDTPLGEAPAAGAPAIGTPAAGTLAAGGPAGLAGGPAGAPGSPNDADARADVGGPVGTAAAGGPAQGRTPADAAAPTHERAQDAPLEHGPDGELRTPRVLPQRVRNASLAEQLREANAPGGMLPPPAGFPGATGGAGGNTFGSGTFGGGSFGGSTFGGSAFDGGTMGGTAAGGAPGAAAAGTADPGPIDDPSPQRSRATMAAIQRGTRTARAADPDSDATAVPPAPAAPSAAKDQQ
ncbi:ATP-binding protein [Kitasatospora sp. CM 4170]|uniref:histidine kinase n=1 Tax=Kitasatospora aburaviensis TaxID=67265 RepID=A0ABW1EPB6_9ACTN|nr:ATP-binding protein [Kitasatospora sp. CM 4170]WNM48462.1 ATP-binding protein [Kitasatospora sp. CM 4170]